MAELCGMEQNLKLEFKKKNGIHKECSAEQFVKMIKEAICTMEEGKEAVERMEYFRGDTKATIIPGTREKFFADMQPGSSEGVVLSLSYSPDGTREHATEIGCAKTLNEDSVGYQNIGTLAGLFLQYAYKVMLINFHCGEQA